MISLITDSLPKDVLVSENLAKSDLLALAEIKDTGIDYALPQGWLDWFVDEYGKKYNFTYQDMIYSTFWQYKTTVLGVPLSFMREIDLALQDQGFDSTQQTLAKIKKGDTKR